MYFSVKKLSVEVAKALRERFVTICSLAGTWGGGLTCFLIIICTNGANYNLLIQSHSFIYSIILWLFVTPILMQNVGFDKKSAREAVASIFYNHKVTIGYDENTIDRNIAVMCKSLDIEVQSKEILNKNPFIFPSNIQKSNSNPYVV